MTPESLDQATGCGIMVAGTWADPLTFAMGRASIATPLRQAAFLAQIGHESSGFSVLEENLDYSAEGLLRTFPKHFDADTAAQYARQPEKIANRVYAGRNGNGDEASGDGWAFRGRGLIQLTGRQNYTEFGHWYGRFNFVKNPDLLTDPANACISAAWFWLGHDLNVLADTQDFRAITQAINGGQNGAEDREARYARARAALSLAVWHPLG